MIRKATIHDKAIIAELAHLLWPKNQLEDLCDEFSTLLTSINSAVFLCVQEDHPVAFAQCQLRFDYVEGTHSTPVGYLEGIYVRENLRHQGIAKSLLQSCESWAREHGCTEFASDCELHNTDSLVFHMHCGFAEANRIICFTKKL